MIPILFTYLLFGRVNEVKPVNIEKEYVVETECGQYAFYGDTYNVGDSVILVMNNNNTLDNIEDDIVVNVY